MPKVCKLIKVLLHVGDLRPSGLMYWALSLFQSEGPEFIELPSISPSHWISASRTVPIKRAGISLVAVYQVPHSLGSKHLIPGLRSHNSLSPTVPCFTDPYMFIHNVPSWVDLSLNCWQEIMPSGLISQVHPEPGNSSHYFPGWFTLPINEYNDFIHKGPTASK